MGDIGNAAAGAMNAAATMYSAERNYDAQIKTNESNEFIHQSDNQFNAGEALKNRQFQTGERIASQDFNAAQADLNRQFQSTEADKARQFQIDSIGKAAAEYQKLGINPAGTVQGVPSGGSSPAGSAASSSPSSGSAASAASFGGLVAPRFDGNPMSSFIEAFQSAQRTHDEHLMSKLMRTEQDTKNQFLARKELLSLRQQNADIQQKLSSSRVSDEQKSMLKKQQYELDLNIKYLENTLSFRENITKQEAAKLENENKLYAEQIVYQQLQNEWLPKIMASQVNLSQAQASAVLTSAKAALSQSLVAAYDAKTRRMEYRFDEAKFATVLRDNINADTKLKFAQAGASSAAADESSANADYVRQKPELEQRRIDSDLTQSLINSVSSEMKSVAHALGATFLVGGKGSKPKKPDKNAYDINPYSGATTSTSYHYYE